VGEASSLEERSSEGISERNCLSGEVRMPMDGEVLWPGAAHGRGGACRRGKWGKEKHFLRSCLEANRLGALQVFFFG
jgi:hypothetical protein